MTVLKKGLVFLVAKTLKDVTNLSLNLAKLFHYSLSHLKPIPYFIPMLPSILKSLRFVTSLSPP